MGAKESNLLEPQMVGATYLWQVKDYSVIPLLKPTFSSPLEVCGDSYRFELHKNGNLVIKLHQNKSSDTRKKFRCVSAFLDHRGMQHYSETKDVEIRKEIDTVELLSIPQIVIENEISDVFLMDRFSFVFKISDFEAIGESAAYDTEQALETLSCDLGKLYEDKIECDVVLKAEAVEYKAHRLVLTARSPTFAQMLRQNAKERSKGHIDIKDVDASILGNILYYIYTGKVQGVTSNTASKLAEAADKYQLLELKNMCTSFLGTNLTKENICDAVLVVEKFRDEALKKAAFAFMCENAEEVINSDRWTVFKTKHPEIANSVLSNALLSVQKRFVNKNNKRE